MYFGRGKNVAINPYNFSEMYDDYIKDKEIGSPYYISRSQYIDINGKYFKELSNNIFDGEHVKLPYMLGYLRIIKFKLSYKGSAKIPIDWTKTVEYDKRIFNLNEHSKGFMYKFHWDKKTAIIKNIFYYSFNMCRDNKRRLAKIIKQGSTDYYEKV